MRHFLGGTIVAAALAVTVSAGAQAPGLSKVAIKTTDLGHSVYMLEGGGGNITVAVGDDAIIMVDAQALVLAPKIKAATRAHSDLPLRYLINTHYHGDHTGGNPAYAADGTIIIGHNNMRKRLAEPRRNLVTGETTTVPAAALPAITYATSITVRVGGQTAEIRHIGPAHTDGDS